MQFPDMFLQVKIPAKAFSTDLTNKRLLLIVGVHMEGQIVHLINQVTN